MVPSTQKHSLTSNEIRNLNKKLTEQLEKTLLYFNSLHQELLVPEHEKTGGNARSDNGDDCGNGNHERSKRFAEQARQLKIIKEINIAKIKIENGTYGKCAGCGKIIFVGKLKIIPEAAYCTKCQLQIEKNLN
jgi:DnaK suppressor protein